MFSVMYLMQVTLIVVFATISKHHFETIKLQAIIFSSFSLMILSVWGIILGSFLMIVLLHHYAWECNQIWINPEGIGFNPNLPTFWQSWLSNETPDAWTIPWSEVSCLQLRGYRTK